MRRPRAAKSTVSVELFPFLAVLMCAMGALLLLLVVVSRQARMQAEQEALAAARPRVDTAAPRLELQGRIDALASGLATVSSDLARRQEELSLLEERARRLRQQLAELEAAAGSPDAPEDDAELRRRLECLRAEIAKTEEALDKARFAAAQAKSAFAIVPYVGPNGTNRRPIYIECRRDAIVLQPEGIVLGERDFPDPLGNNNPLAAAVRVAAEYYQRMDAATGLDSGEPYPLFLVRPEGIEAYYVGREALAGWKSDFGYEFIESDWKVKFDAANPVLGDMQRLAVQDARGRQQRLAIEAPRLYSGAGRGGRRTGFRVAPGGGGLVRDSDGQPATSADVEYGGGSRYGGRQSRFGSGGGYASGGGDSSGGGNAFGSGQPESIGSDPASQGTGAAAGADSLLTGNRGGDGATGGTEGTEYTGGTAEQTGGSPAFGAAAGQAGGAVSGSGLRPPSNEAVASDQQSQPAEWRPGEYREQGSTSASGRSGGTPPPMASQRGADWALPDRSGGSIPITRPIRIVCDQEYLMFMPEGRGNRGGKRIELGVNTSDAMDDMVGTLWEVMDGWGIAGKGMYWKPILQLEVTPTGAERYAEIESLLQGSGLTVSQKEAAPQPRRTTTPNATRRGATRTR